jgi:holo-[acyl-carrier protein] synthase
MDIVGIGTDACEIDRIAASLEKYGDRFLRKVYTEGEVAYCRRKRDPSPSLAARFAAKEAAAKALGTGIARGVFWTDIEVVRGKGGPPSIVFHGGAAERFAAIGGTSSLLTLTHARELAIAHVLLLTR